MSGFFFAVSEKYVDVGRPCLLALTCTRGVFFFAEHPCNMKEFKLYVGLNPDHMIQVLHAGLRDDAVPETFAITHVNRDGVPFPTRFIKIVPLS